MLRIAAGYEAHGIYWALIPHIYKYENRYPLANAKQKEVLASLLHIDVVLLESTIQHCIECENLLEIVDGYLTCDRVKEELEHREDLSEKRVFAGRLGGRASAKQRSSKASLLRKQNQPQDNTIHNNTIHKDSNKRRALTSADFVFPSTLDNQKSKDLLDAFIRHRSEIKKPVTRAQIEQVLKRYATKPDDFVTNLEHSLENGWRGIHPPKPNERPGNRSNSAADTILSSLNLEASKR